MSKLESTRYQWRISAIFCILFVGAMVLVWRVVLLQLLDVEKGHQFLQKEGADRAVRIVQEDAPRGLIVDRSGNELAVSTPVVTLGANPKVLLADKKGLNTLAEAMGESYASLEKRLKQKQSKQFVYLKRHLSPADAGDLMALDAKGVRTETSYRRFYPAGETVAHLVGFNNIDDQGQEGVELAFNDFLKPKQGRKRILQDRYRNTVRELEQIEEAAPGNTLVLSIDLRIQYVAFTALAKAVKSSDAKSGSMVLADSKTGELLALVNYPSYNPNNRRNMRYEDVRNRAVTDVMEPGSTAKPFAVLAALDTGVIEPNASINTAPGYISVGAKVLRDSRNNGVLSISQVLAKSSQVGITKIALETDPFDMRSIYEKLGVGAAVGTGFPGEAVGRLPSYRQWRDIDRATMAFGHGISMSALQLTQAYQALANGGVKIPLTLTKRNEVPYSSIAASPVSTKAVVDMLSGTLGKGGTASSSAVKGYELAGKTGTAHKLGKGGYISDRYRALFAGIAPADKPQFVAVVVIDEPSGNRYYGGEVAAPVFAEVASTILPYLGVKPKLEAPKHMVSMATIGGLQ